MDERSNMKGKPAISDWEEFGRPALVSMIERTGLGVNFGWKVFIRDTHYKPRRGEGPIVRSRAIHDSQKRIELVITPLEGNYQFEVDLATGRNDRPWLNIRHDVEKAIFTFVEPPKEQSAEAVIETKKPDPKSEAILGTMDLSRLMQLRDGFDTLITVGKDVATATEMKREYLAIVEARRAEASPLKEKVLAAAAAADRARDEAEAAQERATNLAKELQEAMLHRDETANASVLQAEVRDKAILEYAPARDALTAAEKDLAEAERMAAERMKTLSKAGDVAVLLAALQKISAE